MTGKSELQRKLDGLWGGVLEGTDFDVARQAIRIRVKVIEGGVTRLQTIVAEGVVALDFHNSIPAPWDYAEVTSLHLLKADGHLELDVEFWSDECELTVKAKWVRVETHSIES